jgi:hypothetical protein
VLRWSQGQEKVLLRRPVRGMMPFETIRPITEPAGNVSSVVSLESS